MEEKEGCKREEMEGEKTFQSRGGVWWENPRSSDLSLPEAGLATPLLMPAV